MENNVLKKLFKAAWIVLLLACCQLAAAAPTVSVSATPSNPVAPATVMLSVAATTDGDPVMATQVEYFNGSTSLGVSVQSPFTLTLDNLAAGTYQIIAKVTTTDPANPVLQSAPMAVTVGTPSGAATAYFIHTDQLNTPRTITDGSGNLVWQWDSDPYGKEVANEQPAGQPAFAFNLRFPGQQFDRESNLHYNYFRDYDPALGRYIQSDPIGLKGGINTYSYVSSAPTSNVDPFGLVRRIDPQGEECRNLKDKISRRKAKINERIRECKENPSRLNLPYYPPYPGAPPRMSVQGHEEIIQAEKDFLADDEKLYRDKCGGDGGDGSAPAPVTPPAPSSNNADAAKKTAEGLAGLGMTYWIISESLRFLFPPRNFVPVP